MIESLSQDREKLQLMKESYGLKECEALLLNLIEEQNIEEITGALISKVQKEMKSPDRLCLLEKQQL